MAMWRAGDVCVMLPRAFRGPVHLESRKGALVFLPVLREALRIVSAEERNAVVMLGAGTAGGPLEDRLSVTSAKGTLLVGFLD